MARSLWPAMRRAKGRNCREQQATQASRPPCSQAADTFGKRSRVGKAERGAFRPFGRRSAATSGASLGTFTSCRATLVSVADLPVPLDRDLLPPVELYWLGAADPVLRREPSLVTLTREPGGEGMQPGALVAALDAPDAVRIQAAGVSHCAVVSAALPADMHLTAAVVPAAPAGQLDSRNRFRQNCNGNTSQQQELRDGRGHTPKDKCKFFVMQILCSRPCREARRARQEQPRFRPQWPRSKSGPGRWRD